MQTSMSSFKGELFCNALPVCLIRKLVPRRRVGPPRLKPFLGTITGKQVNVMATDFNFEDAWRLVLGVRNAPPGVIRSSDLDPITRLVEADLGEPANFRQADVFQ